MYLLSMVDLRFTMQPRITKRGLFMSGLLQKTLRFMVTGSSALVFAACYGAAMDPRDDLENTDMTDADCTNQEQMLTVVNTSQQPIPNLQVSLLIDGIETDGFQTDQAGQVWINYCYNDQSHYSVRVEDVDGSENLGLFARQEVDLNANDTSTTITLLIAK
jgi:hypothetical protein